jgi:hypothetical protein
MGGYFSNHRHNIFTKALNILNYVKLLLLSLLFFTICVFGLHFYHSPFKTGVLSPGAMELHTLVGHGL